MGGRSFSRGFSCFYRGRWPLHKKVARTIGDLGGPEAAEQVHESLQANVQRLKEYAPNLSLFLEALGPKKGVAL